MRVSLTGKDNNRFDDLSKMIGELSEIEKEDDSVEIEQR